MGPQNYSLSIYVEFVVVAVLVFFFARFCLQGGVCGWNFDCSSRQEWPPPHELACDSTQMPFRRSIIRADKVVHRAWK